MLSLYISHLNVTLGKQIIGFDAPGAEMMCGFPWPGNTAQLKRVLHQLMTGCTEDVIQSGMIADALRRERAITPSPTPALPLLGTLDEINCRIAREVLARERGNHTHAARRLGISRSTLWRMLKQESTSAH